MHPASICVNSKHGSRLSSSSLSSSSAVLICFNKMWRSSWRIWFGSKRSGVRFPSFVEIDCQVNIFNLISSIFINKTCFCYIYIYIYLLLSLYFVLQPSVALHHNMLQVVHLLHKSTTGGRPVVVLLHLCHSRWYTCCATSCNAAKENEAPFAIFCCIPGGPPQLNLHSFSFAGRRPAEYSKWCMRW